MWQRVNSNIVDPWLACLRSSETARFRLLCFPHAGGSPVVFARWKRELRPEVELWAVHYPGRSSRFNERPFNCLARLVEALAPRLRSISNKRLVFFGHSLGALVAFETARWMRRSQLAGPSHLIVSACPAPHLLPADPPIHQLPNTELLEELKVLGGMPQEILANQEILDLMLPVIRADVAMLETYRYSVESPLALPITALGGNQDPTVEFEQLKAWEGHTATIFRQRLFPGEHFYMDEQTTGILHEISRAIGIETIR